MEPFENSSGSAPLKKHLLSTSSPEGIQIASKITATRLAELLIRKGPLPIRHITSQLALEVHGFDLLSLSKQRRLIMAAMEQTDAAHNVVFEKIGWGQWAVRKIDSDYIVTEGTEGNLFNKDAPEATSNDESVPVNPANKPHINVKDLRNQPNLKLGWTKKQSGKTSRRESITGKKPNLHNVKLPTDILSSSAIASDSDQDEEDEDDLIDAVIGDESSSDNDEESSSADESDSDELFQFDHDNTSKRSPPIKFANRVPLKLSPPPTTHPTRRKSSSSNSVNKNTNYNPRYQIFNRSRLNSLDNLDNYIISSAKNSNGSFSSPPPPPPNVAAAALSGSPLSSWNSNAYLSKSPDSLMMTKNGNRRRSSFNESHIRSTLSASVPRVASNGPSHKNSYPSTTTSNLTSNVNSPAMNPNTRNASSMSDTDEEDWATIGPESLRKRHDDKVQDEKETKAAAFALVDLMSV
ncbi:DNA-binding proteins Bright/BRCAA1/RBP1 and proteins containing BRIGHT domain [Yamadazyma tenuis]|uniref:Sin3 binding protein n=1 Tax=Candida tenuis (strain ATCC 10573 / BCRC 21748 / CBS 615 / JCM 9827 / NBRC 10315 / NRRL Y-1498 / VKM Y-70) TaxID=590646 RepID=G3BEN6_CANTC|nr:uncharacterized protein CANTEDRAFT_126576 [Yamadazyma tenuis ATCC 10573]EGV59936.1 hypothetical protein CANTEDRAFT_126576 [Yamadazyma tenuis ATCC 10573]WEJ94838.1 DNA-binding proteins Bright/BRCAA1/RBP1 and proteins containing BRIGHT domain [Yamadazyma tenuis]